MPARQMTEFRDRRADGAHQVVETAPDLAWVDQKKVSVPRSFPQITPQVRATEITAQCPVSLLWFYHYHPRSLLPAKDWCRAMTAFDLVIRSGSVVDGTGGPVRTADNAISDGRCGDRRPTGSAGTGRSTGSG
jgi:hypothetical protein